MTADFYGSVMRQYSSFLRDNAGNHLYRIACGPYDFNYAWTESLMKDPDTRKMFQGLSLHYYSVVDGWGYKGSATKFDEREWFETFRLNLEMEKQCIGRALKKHSGNYSQTAKALGISLSTLKRKVKQYKLNDIG